MCKNCSDIRLLKIKKKSTAPNKQLTAATKFGPLLLLVLVIPSSWLITYKSSKLVTIPNYTPHKINIWSNQREREREGPAIDDGKHTHVHPPSPPPQHPNHTLPLRRQTPSHPLPEIQTPPLPPRPPHLLLPLPPPPPPLSPPP